MYVKLHKNGMSWVLAVCDEDLIGKTFEEGELCLDVSAEFYKGEKKTKEGVLELFKKFQNINIVGKESVATAIEAGVVSKDNILSIGGIPHAQSIIL